MDKLLVIDDDADLRYSFGRVFCPPEVQLAAASSGEEGLRLIPKLKPDVVIMDVRMGGMGGLETLKRIRQSDPRVPVIIMTAYGTAQTAIEAMRLGAYDYLLKPFDVAKLREVVFSALKAARDMRQVVSYEPLLETEDYALGIVGRCEAMQAVFKLIGQVAPSNATVLITGESGTGKELVARAIYHHSPRSSQPFMAINCAAIPEQLLESELFGHEKGAFTGALAQRIGKFEQCHRGTLFLDEIGDMSLVTQAKILRVLQSGAFERVGGNETVKADVRVLAATNQLLDKAVAGRRFREDLFYRLNVVRIHMPPLRERPGDVRYLAEYFLRNISQGQHPKSISADTLEALDQYSWPGNVRELENVIHRAIVMSKGGIITRVDLPPEIGDKPRVAAAQPDSAAARAAEAAPPGEVGRLAQQLFLWARENSTLKVLPAVERELVICALREANGNQVQAARLLGITRATLRKRMERFHVRQELKFE